MRIVREFRGLEPFDESLDIEQQMCNAVELGMFIDELTGLILTTPTLDDATRPHYLVGMYRLRLMLNARTRGMTTERVGRVN